MTASPQADRHQLVQFSRIFVGFSLIVCILSLYRHGELSTAAQCVAAIGLIIGVTGLIKPESLNWTYHKWIQFGEKLAVVVSKVVVIVTFFLVVTPVALILKLLGKDILNLKIDKQGETSYFSKPDPAIAERHEAPF